jgi:ferrous iron transport protein B
MKKQYPDRKSLTIAVAGNPNCGKSTLINAIAGSKLYVGNWPGVTVEKKEARIDYMGNELVFIDLPGSYSLHPYTDDEKIAVDFLTESPPDIILNVVDSTNLERNLILTLHLLELGIPTVIALNMSDEADQKGYSIDTGLIETNLGVKVVRTSAVKKSGIDTLLKTIAGAADKTIPVNPALFTYNVEIENAIREIQCNIENALKSPDNGTLSKYPARWSAVRLLENDGYFIEKSGVTSRETLTGDSLGHLQTAHGGDLTALMDDERFAQANGLTHLALKRPSVERAELTDRIDRVALNRFAGIPIFLFSMWVMFKLTFDIGNPFVEWFESIVSGPFTRWMGAILNLFAAPDWFRSLVLDGIIAGVGGILVFVPLIFFMMFFITFLEGSGYMARAAFLMDGIMHKMGLHGKSFIPLVLGFGCNVPSVYATRILEDPKDKILTAMISPLISCSARLPVYILFAAVFFPAAMSGTVIWSLYLLGILAAFGMGWLLRKILFKGETQEFIMELPPYRMPSISNLFVHTWDKVKHFVTKAGTVILALTVIIWFLTRLPWGVTSTKDSFLGKAGAFIAPVFEPLGFGTWQASASLLAGIGAKEIVVSSMTAIYMEQISDGSNSAISGLPIVTGITPSTNLTAPLTNTNTAPSPTFAQDLGEIGLGFLTALRDAGANLLSIFGIVTVSAEQEAPPTELSAALHHAFTPLSAYAFLVFVLLYVPCITFIASMVHELGKWKWAGITILYQILLAWLTSFIVYQGGRILGLGG